MGVLSKGTTFADGTQVTSTKLNNLVDDAVFTASAVDDSTTQLSSGKIVVKTVGTGQLATNAVTTAKITDANVTESKLATDSVSTAKIQDNAVTNAKIADNAIQQAQMADGSVGTAEIIDANVTAAKLDGAQTGNAPIYGCRAWVNFDGTTVTTVGGEDLCTIRASGNVSKVVRSTTGTFVIHFTVALPNNDYAVCGITNEAVLGNRSSGWNIRGTDDSLITTTSVTIDVGSVSSGAGGNRSVITLCVFG